MKKIFLCMMLLMSAVVYSQKLKESEVPDAVKNKFNSTFSSAAKVKWEMEDNNYEAEFVDGSNEKSALFTKSGDLLQTETEITASSLPSAIQDAVRTSYPNTKIHEASKIEIGSEIRYEAEIKEGGKSYDLIYSADGKLIEKRGSVENDKDDEK